jgi:hypothetical protein
MSRISPSIKERSGPRDHHQKLRDFPAPFKHEPKEDVTQEDILQYENYILKELDDLEKNFNKIYLDILLLKSITSDSLKANQSYQALTELFLKTQPEKEEIRKLKISFTNFQDKENILFENYLENLRSFNDTIQEYQTNLEKYQENYERLTQEISIQEQEQEQEIGSLKLKKMEVVATSSLTTSDMSHEELEDYYYFDFFLKIEESKEKLNKLKSELGDFCQQQSYQDLAENNDLDQSKIQQKTKLAIKINDCKYKIEKNLEMINLYESKFNGLVGTNKPLEEKIHQSSLMINQLDSFCLELEGFFNSNSLDKFKTKLESLLSNPIEIINNSKQPALSPIPEEPKSALTTDSQEIETVNPEKLFQEVLKNLLDEDQQKTNSTIVLGQEVSRSCSLFDKLKCFSAKGVDEDEQPTISYFLIENKLVKLTYNSQYLKISSEPNSRNLTNQNEDQFRKFSSEETLEKLGELANLKLRFMASWAFDHIDSPQNSSQELSQNILKNITIEIVEIEDLSENQSIPKSIKDEANKLIKKEANKLQQTAPKVTVSIGCFQAFSPKNEKVVAV